jgi:hypothetical protein
VQLGEGFGRARFQDFVDFGGEFFADARKFGEIGVVRHHIFQLGSQTANGTGPVSICPDAKRVLAFDFQKIGNFIKYVGDVIIVYRHNKMIEVRSELKWLK